MSSIFRTLALSLVIISVFIVIAALYTPIEDERWTIASFILAGITLYLGLAGFFAFRKRQWRIDRVQACLLLVILWFMVPLPIAAALMTFHDFSFVDAFFEATSAFTTTGSTVLQSLEGVPDSVVSLRSMVQWLGGLVTLVMIVLILAPLSMGGLPADQATIINREATIFGDRGEQTIVRITGAYALVTILCFSSLAMCQVPPFEAFHLALSIVSTGGFAVSDTEIGEIGNFLTRYVFVIFMIIGGSSIVWHRLLISGRVQSLRNHRETYIYFLIILAFAIIYAGVFFNRAGSVTVLSPLEAIEEGLFTAASLISTTGYEIRFGSFSVLPETLVILLVIVGGCSFSTSGGVSLYRIGGMLNHAYVDIRKLIYPNSVYASKFGSQRYTLNLMKAIWTFFFSVIAVITVGTLCLAIELNSFEEALIASVAAFSNIGGFYSTGWSETGQWTAYDDMTNTAKIILCILMVIGRLHILTLLTAANLTYWRSSR